MAEIAGRAPTAIRRSETILPAAAAGLLLVVYLPILIPLVRQCVHDPNYQHVLAVPIVSAYILWRRRDALKAASDGRGAGWGIALLAVGSVLLVGGTAASELFTARLSFPIMLIGFLALLRGNAFVRAAAFPLLFLFMMIPLPYIIYYKLTFPMQLMSAKMSADFLRLIGIDVVRRGNILSLPTYTLEVVAACSGLRSLMTMATLSLILCAFTAIGVRRKTILVASSIPIAIAANTVRLAAIAIGASAVNPAFADGILHEISGLIVFLAGVIMLLAVLQVLKWVR